jgi:drug/metabolite transporter (DMT)-like permease
MVISAVLASALLHAVWNALAHRATDRAAAVILVHAGLVVVALPLMAVAPVPAPAARPYLAVAMVLHFGYAVLLATAYSLGDFGRTYPLARGTAPLVVAAVAWAAGDRPGRAGLVGVAVVCAGLAVLVGAAGRDAGVGGRGIGSALRGADRRAVVAAVATGLFIAGYTVVDGLGVRAAGSAVGYAAWLLGLHGLTMVAYLLLARRGRVRRTLRDGWWIALVGGALGWASYALVLWAQTRGALAAVAALRETSVVAAAVIGTVVFGERFGPRRIAATLLVAAGVVLLTR